MITLLYIQPHYYEVEHCDPRAIREGDWFTEYDRHVHVRVGDITILRRSAPARILGTTDSALQLPILEVTDIAKNTNAKLTDMRKLTQDPAISWMSRKSGITYEWVLTLIFIGLFGGCVGLAAALKHYHLI